MAARDDSVIRGSLITCLILLVLSIALNGLLWSWGDGESGDQEIIAKKLSDTQTELRDTEERRITLMKMLGDEPMTDDEYEALASTSSGDAEFDALAAKFYRDMNAFGDDVPRAERHYGNLTEFFTNAIRDRNSSYEIAQENLKRAEEDAASAVEVAQSAQAAAEKAAKDLTNLLEKERAEFTTYRNDMLAKMEQAKDSKTKTERDLQELQRKAGAERNQLLVKTRTLEDTIENQKLELNKLRGGRFETVQGEIRYVLRGGRIVSINLGSADALRPGITFGVVDRDDTARLQDADIKASIQITKILGPHLAEARVVAMPQIGNPIIEGDAVYSPFWAPGRTVRIALAGDIDIDGDGRPDNDQLAGMITAAGAEIADNGERSGRIDPGVRFLVVGETPDLGGRDEDEAAAEIAGLGEAKQRATEAGVTVIPAWKLQAYLKTLDDSLTTPLGSAVRGDDFPATSVPGPARRRPVDLPEMFKRQKDNVQRNNDIVSP